MVQLIIGMVLHIMLIAAIVLLLWPLAAALLAAMLYIGWRQHYAR